MITAMLRLTAKGCGGGGGGRKKEWRTITNNEDLAAASRDTVQGEQGAPRFFGIDYSGVFTVNAR